MTNLGLPVPPGFTITTEVCRQYYAEGGRLPEGLMNDVREAMAAVEKDIGRKFGDPENPLLVSVRSGAKFSMPGMMDTILNLGLNVKTLQGLVRQSKDERFAWDANRRFIMMFSDVVLGIPKSEYEEILSRVKADRRVDLDTDLTAEDLKEVCNLFLAHTQQRAGRGFPSDPWEQLELAIEAVFKSWNNERAIVYRRKERIPDDLGTAVNVQAMVFGNLGEDSGTGVAFTRDPSSGEKTLYGEYLPNAQGEDVVAGIRTPLPLSELATAMPEVYDQFKEVADRLERHYRDMMDLEFTIEHGRLFMLQCRVGKRTGAAAVKIAVDMVDEGLIEPRDAVRRVTAGHLDQLLHPRLDDDYIRKNGIKPIARGLAASPGAAVGEAVFDADTAAELGRQGRKVILVRTETNPDDVHGMLASQGILTARGGRTSHAAVVARGFGIPCVAGCESLQVSERERSFSVQGRTIREGDTITIDGTTGAVYDRPLPLLSPDVGGDFAKIMEWADEFRKIGVRANADNPRDASQAIQFGAEGIGLCRTEHMFFERDRLPIVQTMILASTPEEREAALRQLQDIQRRDFEALFETMGGRPITIRLIDPPLHEFLPSYDELLREVTELQQAYNAVGGDALKRVLAEKEEMLKAVEEMREMNPMLGLRGCRLSILFPGIVEMQTRAILSAAIRIKSRGIEVKPEIMIPLVGHVNELRVVREKLEAVAKEVVEEAGVQVDYKFGTMIELPRAALTADEIAQYADFFSFGTNDLTQTTFGYSRDDAEAKFLRLYVEQGILPVNPFETLDRAGVGRLMEICVESAKEVNPVIKLGICGEHGGDPESIAFCHQLGLDYVSCSPFRVPIARLAAAQAALEAGEDATK
ncbi:MAG: pyruvate, phosphate dikinase [Fimbriimonadales bacterium]|nr:MAG: pyruvate, phosphate dikinase [Fimbriimonadales bacterium]